MSLDHDLSHIELPKEEPPPKKRSPYRILLIAALASLVIHIGFVAVSALMKPPANHVEEAAPIRVHMVSKMPTREKDAIQKQVVTIAPPANPQKPNDPQYLAEYDQSVKEQTRSRVTSPYAGRVADRPSAQSPGQREAQPERSKPSPKKAPNGILARSKEDNANDAAKLLPTWKGDGAAGGAPFNDYLKGVQEDNETKLNTAQWAHATFFVRVKEAIARRWNPNKAIRRNDPKGALAGNQDRVTQVTASIDREGQLVSIKVSKESGVYYLDDEAMRAFKDAAPFSNPPKALFAQNDTFEFPFGFVLSYDRGFKFDLDWRPN